MNCDGNMRGTHTLYEILHALFFVCYPINFLYPTLSNEIVIHREPRGFAFVEFVDPYDASDAQYHLNHTVFFGREITVVVAAESRKRPDDMRNRARIRYVIPFL